MSKSNASPSASAPSQASFGVLGGSSVSASQVKSKRPRLSAAHELKPLYDEWQRNPGKLPSDEVRKKLQAEVEELSGFPYSAARLSRFFQSRISKYGDKVPLYDERYPSLSKQAIGDLDQLLQTSANPTPDAIATWAHLIARANPGTTQEDVVTYVSLTQAEQQRFPTPTSIPSPGSGPSSPAVQFVTWPQNNASSSTPQATQSAAVSAPPVQRRQFISPPSNMDRKYTPSPPVSPNSMSTGEPVFKVPALPIRPENSSFPSGPLRPENTTKQIKRRPSLVELIVEGVQEGMNSPTLPTTPNSAAELDALFSNIDKLSHSLRRKNS